MSLKKGIAHGRGNGIASEHVRRSWVRLTVFAVSLQVWYDIASTGIVDTNALVEKGHNFIQVLEPICDEFLAVVQKIEQRDEQDFKYRQNRFREVKVFPAKVTEYP